MADKPRPQHRRGGPQRGGVDAEGIFGDDHVPSACERDGRQGRVVVHRHANRGSRQPESLLLDGHLDGNVAGQQSHPDRKHEGKRDDCVELAVADDHNARLRGIRLRPLPRGCELGLHARAERRQHTRGKLRRHRRRLHQGFALRLGQLVAVHPPAHRHPGHSQRLHRGHVQEQEQLLAHRDVNREAQDRDRRRRLCRLEPQRVGCVQQAGESPEQHRQRVVRLGRVGKQLLVDSERHPKADGRRRELVLRCGTWAGDRLWPRLDVPEHLDSDIHLFHTALLRQRHNSQLERRHRTHARTRRQIVGCGRDGPQQLRLPVVRLEREPGRPAEVDIPVELRSCPRHRHGHLTVNGTVFVDGNLSIDSCDYAVYQGRGTIYVNGTVTFANGAKVCALPISGNPCLETSTPRRTCWRSSPSTQAMPTPGSV